MYDHKRNTIIITIDRLSNSSYLVTFSQFGMVKHYLKKYMKNVCR